MKLRDGASKGEGKKGGVPVVRFLMRMWNRKEGIGTHHGTNALKVFPMILKGLFKGHFIFHAPVI